MFGVYSDGNWRCHTSDCNTPLAVMNKRVYTCCGVVAPLMRGVDRRASVIPLNFCNLSLVLVQVSSIAAAITSEAPGTLAQQASTYSVAYLSLCSAGQKGSCR